MPDNYFNALAHIAASHNVVRSNSFDQSSLLNLAQLKGGMTAHLAVANSDGFCSALTVLFAEYAMQGKLSQFNQLAVAPRLSELMKSHFGGNFFSAHGGTANNFSFNAKHLGPVTTDLDLNPSFAVEFGMGKLLNTAAGFLAGVGALEMTGGGSGHVVGVKVVPGGVSSLFDGNSGLYQFNNVTDLRDFWNEAAPLAHYFFKMCKTTRFTKMPQAFIG